MDTVAEAFRVVPRAGFLPPAERRRAAYDGPIPIGHGQTNSQPRTVADMLRLLDVRPGQRVLDVGSGSGWTTALLAHVTGPTGRVVGVELEPDLVAFGSANLAVLEQPWASIRLAEPGVLGWPALAPYDRILVSAESLSLPLALVEQLAARGGDPGRMVIPVAGEMLLVRRLPRDQPDRAGPGHQLGDPGHQQDDPGHQQGELQVTHHGYYRFVPLR